MDMIRRLTRRARRLSRTRLRAPLPIGRYRARRDLRPLEPDEIETVERFHRTFYDIWASDRRHGRGTISLSWFGHKTYKSPFDLWTYQEILVETRPDVVIETGTRFGGSAYYLAGIMDLLGRGRVLTVDIDKEPGRPRHRRITYLDGSSTDLAVLDRLARETRGKRVMVILDSDHHAPHVLAELRAYRDLVSVGCYLVVEDTNVNGHPVLPDYGPGPMEALEEFLTTTDDYVVDRDRERFLLTLNPSGFLRRVS